MKSLIILLAGATSLMGCASVMDSSASAHQSIKVISVPAGADCLLSNDKGSYQVHTPNTVTVAKTNWPGLLGNKLVVTCRQGSLVGSDSFASIPRGLGWGSVAAGGAAAFADRQTGYAYPDVITITLGK